MPVYSQDDMSQYFNDGGIATSYRLIKIGFDPVNGEVPVMFEYRVAKHISVEWGEILYRRAVHQGNQGGEFGQYGDLQVWDNTLIYSIMSPNFKDYAVEKIVVE